MSKKSALEKIEQERINPTGTLDLSREWLTEVPQELLELQHLTSLNLYWNHIADYSFLKHLTQLQSLNLRDNHITDYSFLQHLKQLRSLNLSYNQISDISFLQHFTQLQSLDLSFNQIADYSFLQHLSQLQSLDLSENKISDYSFLQQLSQLQSLYLSDNQISNISFLQHLSQLQSLDLRNNQISDISFLQHLTQLQSLDLSDNQISDYSSLQQLSQLQSLYLSDNQISDYSSLQQLSQLQSLDLSDNQISDYSFLQHLSQLQSLDLRNNEISDISFLQHLSQLQSLYLSYNQISDISFLQNLSQLQSLDLSENKISDISFLQNLSQLQSLYLSFNQISDISFLQNLSQLQSLYLSDNQISDISFLQNLSQLQSLDLGFNQISDISFLQNLSQLQSLYLSDNQISDISFLQNLSQLQSLYLSDNQIKKIPTWAIDRNFTLEYTVLPEKGKMTLGNNPIEFPPLEMVTQGHDAIVKYFQDLEEQGKDYLYEAKLLIVGDGGAGKTSLAWKIKTLDCDLPKEGEDRTKGIDIQAMPIRNIAKSDPQFLMNVWDFGGQGYYHSTHQFFLTKRSLYVLLNNTRVNKTDFNDWLQTIALFSDSSPVIIVENEVGGSKSELDERGLRGYFKNIRSIKTADLSNTTDKRLEKLIEEIKIEIQRLPHVGSELPKQWVKIRAELKKIAKTEAHIDAKEFFKLCKKHQITEKEAIKRLGDLFHDLGIFLYFRDDKVLKRLVILQNTWATKGVYTILDDDLVRKQGGYFTMKEAEAIWRNTPYEDMEGELVSLMEKFKLCYKVPYDAPEAYISPNLLPVEQPEFDWDEHQNLIIHYEYEFMPKGLLGMLIVELHRYVKDITKLAWRNGCVFTHQNTEAFVLETYGKKKLEVRIKGAHCVVLSSIVIDAIDKLNQSFKQLKVKKLLPCICSVCKGTANPHFYLYDKLMNRKEKRKLTVECDISYKDVNVLEILEASYQEKLVTTPSFQKLIADGKLKEALDVFEQNFPDEATLLLSRFNTSERNYHLGLISTEHRATNRQKITHSLLNLSKIQAEQVSGIAKLELQQLDKVINTTQHTPNETAKLLDRIIKRNQAQQLELIDLLTDIKKKQNNISQDYAEKVVASIQTDMRDFLAHLPDTTDIHKDWQAVTTQLSSEENPVMQLKWVIPFLFPSLEQKIEWQKQAKTKGTSRILFDHTKEELMEYLANLKVSTS